MWVNSLPPPIMPNEEGLPHPHHRKSSLRLNSVKDLVYLTPMRMLLPLLDTPFFENATVHI